MSRKERTTIAFAFYARTGLPVSRTIPVRANQTTSRRKYGIFNMSNAADAINGRRVTKAQNPPARAENVFDTSSKILFSFRRKNESRVFNHDDSEARQWRCVHLAALPAANWQRGFRILADQR